MWKAQFSNGDVLEQFDQKGREVLFQKVLDRLDDLKNLSVILNGRTYTVRIMDGRFSIANKGEVHHFFALDGDVTNLNHIRPIYFVRETIDFSTQGKVPIALGSPQVNFVAIGFQASLNGRNVKRYLAIFPNNTFVVKDK